jgi:hypothetical protein
MFLAGYFGGTNIGGGSDRGRETHDHTSVEMIGIFNPYDADQIAEFEDTIAIALDARQQIILEVSSIFWRTEWEPGLPKPLHWTPRATVTNGAIDPTEARDRWTIVAEVLDRLRAWANVRYGFHFDEAFSRAYERLYAGLPWGVPTPDQQKTIDSAKQQLAAEIRAVNAFIKQLRPDLRILMNFSGPELYGPWMAPSRLMPSPTADAYGADLVSFDLYRDTPFDEWQFDALVDILKRTFPGKPYLLVIDGMVWPHETADEKVAYLQRRYDTARRDPLCWGLMAYTWNDLNTTFEGRGVRHEPTLQAFYRQTFGEITNQ